MQNRILTSSQNELLFDDDQQQPKVILQTLGSEHYLELNAQHSGRQFIHWMSQLGTINLVAGKQLGMQSENDNITANTNQVLHTSSKNDTTITAENNNIALQSATGFTCNAKSTVFSSGQNSSVKTGRAIQANAQSDIQFNTDKGGLSISAPSGATLINANGDITISGNGQGDLTLHNGAGEIKIDAQGNIDIIATDVLTLKGMMTSLDAPVEYEITSPETASTPAAPPQPAIANNALLAGTDPTGYAAVCESPKPSREKLVEETAQGLKGLRERNNTLLVSNENMAPDNYPLDADFDLNDDKQLAAARLLLAGLKNERYDDRTAIDIANGASSWNDDLRLYQVDADAVASGVYDQYLIQTQSLYQGQSIFTRNELFTKTYAQIFRDDPATAWFGLAAIASDKVGTGLAQSFVGAEVLDGVPFLDLDDDLVVLRKGLADGNKRVFDDQYTAYQIYKDAGVEGIGSVINSGRLGDPDNLNVRELYNGYRSVDLAKRALSSGDVESYKKYAGQSLRQLANFEQKIILQPVYDKNYYSDFYKNTLRGSLGNTKWASEWITDKSSWFNPETVDVLGTELNFQGNDLGNVPQRMKFIDNIADVFLNVYNKPNGYNTIVDWHQGL